MFLLILHYVCVCAPARVRACVRACVYEMGIGVREIKIEGQIETMCFRLLEQ